MSKPTPPAVPLIVVMCGSMRFFPQMLTVAAEETLAGRIVLMPFAVIPPGEQDTDIKAALDTLHRHKIDLADRVIVVTNQHGHIGASTRGEIAYARRRHMPIDQRTIYVPPTPEIYYECRDCSRVWDGDDEPLGGVCPSCNQPVRVITVPGRGDRR